MNTVTASFKTAVIKITEMSQWPKFLSKKVTEMSQRKKQQTSTIDSVDIRLIHAIF